MSTRHGNQRTRINKLGARICGVLDEMLYGRELSIARAHQAAIDEIVGQPIPYTLTPKAEAFLTEDVRPEQVDRLDQAARLDTDARRRYPDTHPRVNAAATTLADVIRDSTQAELREWVQRDRRAAGAGGTLSGPGNDKQEAGQ